MNPRIKEYLQGFQKEVILAAEAKLERPLSSQEKSGIENLYSGMRLDLLFQTFSHPSTPPEEVVEELSQYAALLHQEPRERL